MTYINNLRKSENTTITITNKADDICRCCPNLKNDLCGNEKQNAEIIKMDNEILSKMYVKTVVGMKNVYFIKI